MLGEAIADDRRFRKRCTMFSGVRIVLLLSKHMISVGWNPVVIPVVIYRNIMTYHTIMHRS